MRNCPFIEFQVRQEGQETVLPAAPMAISRGYPAVGPWASLYINTAAPGIRKLAASAWEAFAPSREGGGGRLGAVYAPANSTIAALSS